MATAFRERRLSSYSSASFSSRYEECDDSEEARGEVWRNGMLVGGWYAI
jgi:hypothetical protein